MSDLSATLYLHNPVQGHAQLQQAWQQHLKPHLLAGRRLALTVAEAEDELTAAQRAYYHVVLQFVADHATAGGQKFPMPIWKEWFRGKYLPDKFRSFVNPMTGRKSRRRVRVSTEDLGVRGYANLIEQVIAFASTDLGLEVPEPRQPLPKPQRKRQQAMERGEVDQDTGEILEMAA